MRTLVCSIVFAAAPVTLSAQSPAAASPTPTDEAQQIAAAVLPLPSEFRESAVVLGRRPGTAGLVRLRDGRGPFVCLANDPSAERFHVACYHESLEPFMMRGRELRAQGVPESQVDTVRFAEVESGVLKMPTQPAMLYSLTGPGGTYDAATGTAPGARALFVVYIPGATAESTGLSAKPVPGTPWIMYPGTPKAHIMFVPSM
jgi:hypothetical protein